jgi:hypothetical protein
VHDTFLPARRLRIFMPKLETKPELYMTSGMMATYLLSSSRLSC